MSLSSEFRDHQTLRQYRRSGQGKLPRWVTPTIIALAVVALIPLVLMMRARATKSEVPRIQVFPDMDTQPRFRAQAANPFFADRRAMRLPIEGTVARGNLREDDHLYRGRIGEEWAGSLPFPLTDEVMRRGQERFNIFCAPCHGLGGDGDGMVAKRAEQLREGRWIPPLSFHTSTVRNRADGELFNTITNGIRTMPAYGPQIPVEDRWAIVAYLRALQRSQNATPDDMPENTRQQLR